MTTKVCKQCNIVLPATTEYFYKAKSNKDRLNSKCKACMLENNKKYREENPQKASESDRVYYEKNRDIIRKKKQEHYKRNKEDIIEKSKQYYYDNKKKNLHL